MTTIVLDKAGLKEDELLEMETRDGSTYKIIKVKNHNPTQAFSAGGEFFLIVRYGDAGEIVWQKILYSRRDREGGGTGWEIPEVVSFRIKKNTTLLVSVVEALNIEDSKEGRLYVGA